MIEVVGGNRNRTTQELFVLRGGEGVVAKCFIALDDAINGLQNHELEAALRNLFALGCCLHAEGKFYAGRKAFQSAMRAVSFHETHFTEYKELISLLPGNECEFLNKIRASTELNTLIGG
ncbi:hypothetical protein HTZ97_05620 [Desulfuromonas acetoxidans]|uniref:Uncharacterized protein n=1 Tax=Desulfuromonas acetoxidans (strain DSM 684 / 11070) TaxID=281689 RepID=Q1K2Z3_DESA6|nr:hypothetical protein [Desulfuromonas acetoxidans]EAT16738.1 hypothetical protein Dace_1990 [Desulfuromonas acetoxidans DSM 684]NVD23678.1 hypothetical protein [Desulfuromonas acetoxidans]NVE15937.1 hypothetical protein [Desulfuromonas acetoxidans]